VITIRLDPRLKYLAELAARRQRRPLSSYVEWAIEQSLNHVHPSYRFDKTSFADVASLLWDVDEADRFARLALEYPELLNHEEQVLWKLIRECGYLWRGNYGGQANSWQWQVQEDKLIMERLRQHWQTFLKVAAGEAPASNLPKWQETKAATKPPQISKPDRDEDIPY
jgi:hypothetical protein